MHWLRTQTIRNQVHNANLNQKDYNQQLYLQHFIQKLEFQLSQVKFHRSVFWKIKCSHVSNGNKNKLDHELK